MYPWHGCMGGWGMMGGMWFFWLVPFAFFIWALMRREGRPPLMEGPEDIIKKRFARGEIDAAEYRKLLDELRKP